MRTHQIGTLNVGVWSTNMFTQLIVASAEGRRGAYRGLVGPEFRGDIQSAAERVCVAARGVTADPEG